MWYQAVQKVLSNLLLSHVELRTEESIDIQPYTHERRVEKIVVPLGDELRAVQDQYLKVQWNPQLPHLKVQWNPQLPQC